MSEINPSDLVEEINFTVQDANVIPTPIDPTLSHEGEAADAKATGDAIAGVIGNLRVNQKAPVNNAITVYAGDILMSDAEGADTITAAIEAVSDRDASQIIYDDEELTTVKDALDDVYAQLDSELSEAEIDEIFDDVFGGES